MKSAAALLFGTAALGAFAGDGVVIEPLGPNHTLVRVTGEGKYLLLPVQESIDDAGIRLLTNGKFEKHINARLAKSKVDYFVPVDLTPYKGKEVALVVSTSQNRSSVREAENDVCWKEMTVSDTFDTSNREKYRPAYHHTPLWGWMNDPNGMFFKDGVWHLYYQHNPYGSKWQNLSWGHSTSTDLIHWEARPEALEPDGLGMIFSGSCAIDSTGSAGFGKDAVVGMYTAADATQQQALVWSTDDGETLNVYPGNPVITLDTEARDPNMFWNAERGEWVLVLAHALDHEMLILTSPDMKEWTLRSSFGKGLGAQDGVWECPDLFELPVEGTDEKKWVLICNLNPGGPFGGSGTQYFIGDFDGHTFTSDRDADGSVPTKWLDYGKDHYATVSWSDAPAGRRTVIGWMSNWQYAADVPTMQFRSANTLPRDLAIFRDAEGSLRVASVPSPELLSLRGKQTYSKKSLSVGRRPVSMPLPKENDGICEIEAEINAAHAASVALTLSNGKGEKTVLTFNAADGTFSTDRRESGVTDFSQNFPAVTVSPTFSAERTVKLRVFVDRSSIEVFGDNGRFVQTNLVFPSEPYTTLSLSAEGGKAKVKDLRIYSINAD